MAQYCPWSWETCKGLRFQGPLIIGWQLQRLDPLTKVRDLKTPGRNESNRVGATSFRAGVIHQTGERERDHQRDYAQDLNREGKTSRVQQGAGCGVWRTSKKVGKWQAQVRSRPGTCLAWEGWSSWLNEEPEHVGEPSFKIR